MHFLSFICKIKDQKRKKKKASPNAARQRVGGGSHTGSDSQGQSRRSSSREVADSCCCCCRRCSAGEPGVHCLTALTLQPDWCHLSVPLDALCCVPWLQMRSAHRAALTQSSPGYRKNVKMSFIIAHKPAHLVCETVTGRSSAIFASTCHREDPSSGLSDIG